MSLYRDLGVVLRTYKLGEADRIVVLLTAGHGKVRAVAKGVRRAKSRLGGRLEPLSHLQLLMYEGRELDIVSQAEVVEPWRALHEDLACLAGGMAMAEAAEQVAQEGEASGPLYRMLAGFYWKLLCLDGAAPVLHQCASCGAGPPAARLVAFDIAEGGALCQGCRRGQPISPAALELLRMVVGGQLGRALELPASHTTNEVAALATISMERHLERRLRSLRTLERA